LTTPWNKTGAFKAGIVGENGEVLRKARGSADKKVYNVFHKLVYNIKRLLNKVPVVGKATLASYATALYLIKEHTNLTDERLGNVIEEAYGFNPSYDILDEDSSSLLDAGGCLTPGNYEFCEETIYFKNGDSAPARESIITVTEENRSSIGSVFGQPIFQLTDADTGSTVIVSNTQLNSITN
jgi:hypothetical protein